MTVRLQHKFRADAAIFHNAVVFKEVFYTYLSSFSVTCFILIERSRMCQCHIDFDVAISLLNTTSDFTAIALLFSD